MSEISEVRERDEAYASSRDRPVVGIVLTGSNDDHAVRSAIRAKQSGYAVLVGYIGDADGVRALDVIERRDIDVVHVNPAERDEASVQRALEAKARSDGHPGVIYATPEGWIDYEASEEELREQSSYAVRAEPLADETEVLVGIPAYNEAASIQDVVRQVSEYADRTIVVDDGSTDQTVALAREAGATVVEHVHNKGYGGALKTLFAEAARRSVDVLVIVDGDGQHNAADIPKLVNDLEEGPDDIVVGSRFVREVENDIPAYRKFGLWTINVLTNASMGVFRPSSRLADTQSGFRAYNRRAIQSLSDDDSIGDGMNASTDVLYHAYHNNFDVGETGTVVEYDVENGSTHHPLRHGLNLLANILRTIERNHPIAALGVPGLLSAIVGAGFAYWVFYVFLTLGTLPVGSAIASVFFSLTGIFACFTAIILHSLSTRK